MAVPVRIATGSPRQLQRLRACRPPSVRFADALSARGASLVLVLDAPRLLALKLPEGLCGKKWFRPWLPAACQRPPPPPLAAHDADHAALSRMARSLAATHANLRLFDPAVAFCSDGVCRSHDRQGTP